MRKRKHNNLVIVLIIVLILFAALHIFQTKIADLVFNDSEIQLDAMSKNCVQKGGISQLRTRGDQNDYKVCIFEDNKQCEEEALYNGDCPNGGVRITGYITEASVYCAITGGTYKIGGNIDGVENGTCSFFNGASCNVWDLYNGKCEKGKTDVIDYNNEDYNFYLKLPQLWDDKYAASEIVGSDGIKYISFNYLNSDLNLFKIAVVPTSLWNKQTTLKQYYLGRDNDNFFATVYSTDPLRSNQQPTEEYLNMVLSVQDIIETFKITKPYLFSDNSASNGSNYSIEVITPLIGGIESAKVNLEINSLIANIISQFKNEINASESWKGKNTLKIFYDPREINSNFVSIRIETEKYTGGAHGENISYSFNYDFVNDRVLGLADIFNDDYVKTISSQAISHLLNLNQNEPFTNDDWINQGAGNSEGNFKAFAINRDYIVFYFNPYQVAPYSAGRQEFSIPWSSLKGILNTAEAAILGLKI